MARRPRATRCSLFRVVVLSAVLGVVLAGCGGGDENAAPGGPDGLPDTLYLLDLEGFVELDGGSRRLLVQPPPLSFIYDAAVSRERDRIALAIQMPPKLDEDDFDFGVDLFVAREGEEELEEAALHESLGEIISRPNWLPGGERIVFSVYGRDEGGMPDLRIEVVDLRTGERRRLVERAVEPALSPDARTLAYVAMGEGGLEEIRLLDLEGGETRPLLPDSAVAMVNVGGIAWSPDGRRLAFAAADPVELRAPAGGGEGEASAHPTLQDVWVAGIDGEAPRRVAEVANMALSLAWSADNEHVYAMGETGFLRVNMRTGAKEVLGEGVLAGKVQTLFEP